MGCFGYIFVVDDAYQKCQFSRVMMCEEFKIFFSKKELEKGAVQKIIKHSKAFSCLDNLMHETNPSNLHLTQDENIEEKLV